MAEETSNTERSEKSGWGEIFDSLPLDELKSNVTDYISALGDKTIHGMGDKVNGFIEQLGSGGGAAGAMGQAAQKGAEKLAEGESPVKAGLSGAATGVKEKVKETFGGGSGGGSGGKKFTSIIKTIDVGVPLSVAYNQWTQFEDWTDFMKKVESVEQESEEKINFKGQVFWSHRTWDSTITQQVADEQIVWRSTGEKGHLDGAVTFHELAPRLTRILAIVDYYPQGFMEKTGNIWRAVHRRVKVEMDRYIRQVMTSTILDPDSVEGWRGEIRDSEVVRTHEEVVEEEQAQQEADEQSQDAPQDESVEEQAAAEDEAPVDEELPAEEDEPADEEPVAEDEVPAEDTDEEPVEEELPADEEAEPAEEPVEEEPVAEDEEELPAEDEEPVDEEPVEEEPPAEEEAEPVDEEPVEEDIPEEEVPADESAEETEEPDAEADSATAGSSGSKRSSTSKKSSGTKRSSSRSKSGGGSKTTRSTSKRKQPKRS